MNIYILAGKRDEGKSAYTYSVYQILKNRGWKIGGFIVLDKINKASSEKAKDLYLINKDIRVEFTSPVDLPGSIKIGHEFYNPEAIKAGLEILKPANAKDCEIVIVDNIGKYELNGKIWGGALVNLLKSQVKNMIWVVNEDMIEAITNFWNLENPKVFYIRKYKPEDLVVKIFKDILKDEIYK